MFKIQTLNKISPIGLDQFPKGRYEFSDDIDGADAVVVRSADMHGLDIPDSVLAIARAGAGVNNIPLDACSGRGIVVFNTPGANANAVKEMVVTGLLLSSRKVLPAIEWAASLKGQGDAVPALVEKGKGSFVGPELMGKTLGIIGLGAVGVLVANIAASLGMRVLGHDPFISVEHAWKLSRRVEHARSLSEVYEQSDYITIHVPYTKDTKGMINSAVIATMKTGVRILNFARGELVESDDILEATGTGKVGVYVTDFPTDAMLEAKGVIAIPHLGASTPESEDNCAQMASAQLVDYLENGNIVNSVNMPELSMARSGKERVCVFNRNMAGMLSEITGVLSQNGINIANMTNKSRGDFAYTVLDVDTEVTDAAKAALHAIDGVVKVRVIA